MDGAILLAALGGVVGWTLLRARRGVQSLSAGGTQPALLVCLGLAASFLGGGFSFGLAGQAWQRGVGAVLTFLGFSVGTVLVGTSAAPGLQAYRGCGSVGDVIDAAYGVGARRATGALAALFCCAVLGAQLRAMGLALSVWLAIDWRLGVAIGAVLIVALAAFGGTAALQRAAPVQTALLLGGIALALVLGLLRCGGGAGLVQRLPTTHLQPLGTWGVGELIGLFLLFAVGETLSPPAVQRLLEARDTSSARQGALLAGGLSAVMFLLAGALGLIARALFPAIDAGLALPTILSATLPPGLLGLAAAGVAGGLVAAGSAYLGAAADNLRGSAMPSRGGGRVLAVVIGVGAAAVAILSPGVMGALTLAYRLWAPAITVPLVLACRGGDRHPVQFWVPAVAGLLLATLGEHFPNPFGFPATVFGIMGAGILSLPLAGIGKARRTEAKEARR